MWVRTFKGDLINLALATGVSVHLTSAPKVPWHVRAYWAFGDSDGYQQAYDVLAVCESQEQAREYLRQIANRLEATDGGEP